MAVWTAILGLAIATQVSPAAPSPTAPAAPTRTAAGWGTVTVALADDDTAALAPQDRQALVEGVGAALADGSFFVLPGSGPSRYVATVSVRRDARGTVTTSGKEAAPTTNLGNWGAGARVTLPTGKQQLRGLSMTTLTLRIATRQDGRTIWTGSALTAQVDGTVAGSPAAIGRKLTAALIAQFPRPLEGPVSVP